MQPDEAYWDSMEPEQQRQYLDIVAEVLAAADAVDPVRRQHAAALDLCDEAESAVGSGCLCRWDEDGSPVGEHGPRCFKTFGWDLDPAAVRAALEEDR